MKMKNNKLFSRVLALSAALLLVVALAVPCFADAPDTVPDDALEAFYDSWEVSPHPILKDVLGDRILSYSAVSYGSLSSGRLSTPTGIPIYGLTVYRAVGDVYLVDSEGGYLALENQSIEFNADADSPDFLLTVSDSNNTLMFVYIPDGAALSLVQVKVNGNELDLDSVSFSVFIGFTDSVNYMNDFALLLGGTQDSVAYPAEFYEGYIANTNGGSGSASTAKTGLFGQLYYILKDAIYGEGVAIGSYQDFMLTQISTWTVYALVFIPIIIGVCFMVKCFRW